MSERRSEMYRKPSSSSQPRSPTLKNPSSSDLMDCGPTYFAESPIAGLPNISPTSPQGSARPSSSRICSSQPKGPSHAAAVLQPFFAAYERACDHLGLAVHLVHLPGADALDPGELDLVGAGAAAVEHGLQAFQVSGLEGRMAHHPVHHRGSQAYELNPMLFDELERLSFIEAFHEVHGLPEEQSDVRGIAVQVVKQGTGDKLFRPRGLPRHRRPSRQIHLAVGRPDFLHDELGFSRRPSRRDSPRGLAGEERQDLGSMGELSSDPVPHVLLRYAILVVAIPCRYQQLALEQRVYMVAFFIGSLGGT